MKCGTAKTIAVWAFSSPVGQLVMLIIITIPLGIYSLIVAQDSYDKLNEAVGQFNDILDTWTIKPLTAVEAVTAGGSCSAGYEKLTTASWPELSSVPCACPGLSYQPFNQATSGQITTAANTVYGYGRRRRAPSATYDSESNPLYIGDWGTTYAWTNGRTYDQEHEWSQTSGGSRRRNMNNGGSGSSYYGATYSGLPSCTDSGLSSGNDLAFGGSCSTTVSGSSGSCSCSYAGCFIESHIDYNGTQYYQYSTYTVGCGLTSKQVSATSACSGDQTRMRCTADATTASATMDEWRNKVICGKRDGTEAVSSSGAIRPDPDDGSCPSGYSKCGSGDYNTNRATCAASGSDCPLTSIKVLDSTSSDYVAADWSSTSQLDGNYLLVSRNASTTTSSELPVTSTWLGFSQRCVGGGRNLDSYGVAGSRAAVSWSVSYSSACSNTDSRWTKIDERTSQSFLQDNFDTQCSAATGNVIDWNDLTAVSVSGTNYYIYGVTGSAMNADSGTYCDSGDNICSTVMSRTLCTKLSSWASSSSNSGVNANPYFMEEIYFKIMDECATKEQLYDSKPTINECKDAVLTQLVLMYIAFICGFILAVLCIVFDWLGMHDNSAADDCRQTTTHRVKDGFALCMGVGLIISMVIAFVAALNLDDVYSNAKKCTDSISSEYGGFETLNDTINDVESNTIINLIIQCVMMVIYIYGLITATAWSAQVNLDEEDEDSEKKLKQPHKSMPSPPPPPQHQQVQQPTYNPAMPPPHQQPQQPTYNQGMQPANPTMGQA